MFELKRDVRRKFFVILLVFFPLLVALTMNATATLIFNVVVDPKQVVVNTPTNVTIAVEVTDPALILSSIDLERIGDNYEVIDILSTPNDDGLNGDGQTGDGIYTTQITIMEPSPVEIKLRISGLFEGIPKPIHSDVVLIEVVP